MTSKPLTAQNSEQLTLFHADSLVSRFPLPGSEEARKMTATSGQKWFGLLKSQSPAGLLVKMLLGSSVWASDKRYLTWKASDTKSGRLLFRLWPSVPNIKGIDCGLWRTPTTSTGGCQSKTMLERIVNGKRRDSGATIQLSLRDQVLGTRLWPTPTAQDAKNLTCPPSQAGRDSIPGRIAKDSYLGGAYRLNVRFVESLMGYPIGWTDIE